MTQLKVLTVCVTASVEEALKKVDGDLQDSHYALEALEKAQKRFPDCVVIDCKMGLDKALQLACALKGDPRHANIVIIGLLDGEQNAAEFDNTILSETFRKPFDENLLAERARILIGRKHELDEIAAKKS